MAIVKDVTDNSLVFIDQDHNEIRRIDASGTVSTVLSGFNLNSQSPQSLTIDPSTGNLFATDGQNVFCIPKSGSTYGIPNIFATQNIDNASGANHGDLGWSHAPIYDAHCLYSAAFNTQGIAFAPASGSSGDYLYVSGHQGDGDIWQLALGSTTNVLSSTSPCTQVVTGLYCPNGLAYSPSNTSLFVVDAPDTHQGGVIRYYAVPRGSSIAASSGTTVTGIVDNPASGDALAINSGLSPSANIAVDSDGGLYIADTGNNLLRYVPAITSGSYTAGNIYTIAGGGSASIGISAPLHAPTGLFVDASKTIFMTEGSSSTGGNNYIRRIAFPPAAISLASISAISALTVPYYSKVAFSGGGTAKLTADNSTNLYGGVVLSGTATVELNLARALGAGISSTNTLTLGTGTALQAGNALAAAGSEPSVILQAISYTGAVTINTADDVGDLHSLATSAISSAAGTNSITIKGGGTYTPGGAYTAGGTDTMAVVDTGTTLKLTDPAHVPSKISLGTGTILDLGCNLSGTSSGTSIVIN